MPSALRQAMTLTLMRALVPGHREEQVHARRGEVLQFGGRGLTQLCLGLALDQGQQPSVGTASVDSFDRETMAWEALQREASNTTRCCDRSRAAGRPDSWLPFVAVQLPSTT